VDNFTESCSVNQVLISFLDKSYCEVLRLDFILINYSVNYTILVNFII